MAKRSEAAPTRTGWLPPALGGVGFIVGAFVFAGARTSLNDPFTLPFAAVPFVVGVFLLVVALRQLQALRRAAAASSLFSATIVEVRRDIEEMPNAAHASWSVVARGTWPDGRPDEFRSAPLRDDPRDRFLPGQLVTVRGDIASRVYTMDLSTVAGAPRPAAEMRSGGPAGPAAPVRMQPRLGLAIGGGMALVGILIVAAAPVVAPMGYMVGAFGALICGLSYLGLRNQSQLQAAGVSFPATVSRITHSVIHSGGRATDRWTVEADGAWPDGVHSTFYGLPLTALGGLKEGDTVWVRGDPRSKHYELMLTPDASAAPAVPSIENGDRR